jgi:hypothetical protein
VRAVNPNYATAYAFATLTILPSTQALTFASLTFTYDGKAYSLEPATTNAIGGAEISYSTGGDFADKLPAFINAGVYKITARATNPNYETAEKAATLTIKDQSPEITGEIKGVPKVFKYKASGFGNSINVSLPVKNATVNWTVSPTKYASVKKTGSNTATITFKNYEGQVKIRASLSNTKNAYKEASVTLVRNVTTIKTPLKKYYIAGKKSFTIPVVLEDKTDKFIKNGVKSKLTWKLSKPKFLKINSKGKVTILKKVKKKTKVVITVKAASGEEKKIAVYILPEKKKQKKVERIEFKFLDSLRTRGVKEISVKVYPPDATDVKISFKSSDSSGLYIDKTGTMIARRKGVYKVTVIAGGVKETREYKAKLVSKKAVSKK